ncbi:LOW QUALITY PROTEIN: uncharacterized protein ttc23 [Fundulus diaphanus]
MTFEYGDQQANKEACFNLEIQAQIQNVVRRVTLTRLVFVEKQLQLAIHARLVKAYFDFKGCFCKAHAIAMSHSPEGLAGAQISHSLDMILSATPDQHHNETVGHYFERSLRAYRKAFLAAQDDSCRFLLINGPQEEIQKPLKD